MATATDTPARAMSEAELYEGVADLLKGLGWRYFHISAKAYKKHAVREGFLDLIMVKGGRLLFAELKRETGNLSDEQQGWLADLRRHDECCVAQVHPYGVYVWKPSQLLDGTIARILAGGRA